MAGKGGDVVSEHDPLCETYDNDPYECICDEVRRARADERERIAQAIEAWPDGDDTTSFSETMPWVPQEAAARIARGEH